MVLRATGIRKVFPGVIALDEVDLDLHQGEIHGLLGENGAGKSTLIKVLAGYHVPDAGRLELAGRPVTFRGPREAREAGVATIYQELTLAPDMTVAENICLGREPVRLGRIDRVAMRDIAQRALARLGVDLDPDVPVRQLGVAVQQMVEIARALSMESRVLILDEPTAALTPAEVERLFTILRGLRLQGVAILYISHRLEEVLSLCDRVTVLRDGRAVATVTMAEADLDVLIRLMAGRSMTERYPPRYSSIGDVVLDVRGATRQGVFHGVSLQVRRGEVVGLAGLLGAGRTELLRAIAGADPLDEGEVWVEGRWLPPGNPGRALRCGVALVPEDRKRQGLFLQRPLRENLTLAALPLLSRAGWVSHRAERQLARDLVRRLAIRCRDEEQVVAELSGGNQQKAVLARWLAIKPRVLLLDEPTRGVDISAKVELYTLINSLAEDGVAIVMASSDLSELLGMCDRIMVMAGGRIVKELPAANASKEAVLRAAAGGAE
nr:sugar ABC transporter ATP-binding protein [Thermaerobacter sp. FW80]